MSTYIFSEKYDTCAFIEELFRLVRLFFLESLSPCTVIKDCTSIRDLRVGQRWRCCFWAACPNRKTYLVITGADEGLFRFQIKQGKQDFHFSPYNH